MPIVSNKLEAFFIPGMYFVGWPHRLRKSRPSPNVVALTFIQNPELLKREQCYSVADIGEIL